MITKEIKVILVDDEFHIKNILKKILNKDIFNIVAEGSNGQEAVDLYKKEKPDLLLMDIAMPLKTGLEALTEIIDFDSDANVIMLTSLSDAETVEKALDIGAVNFIRKDTDLMKIEAIIRETFNITD